MKEITTKIVINASFERVWEVLTRFESYPKWNPFLLKVEGVVAVGNQIEITLPRMSFKPVVTSFETNSRFSWLGHFLFKGFFDGEHCFILTENADGTTLLEHGERFSGLLVPLLSKELRKTERGFVAMNEALKNLVEMKG